MKKKNIYIKQKKSSAENFTQDAKHSDRNELYLEIMDHHGIGEELQCPDQPVHHLCSLIRAISTLPTNVLGRHLKL